MLIVAGDCERQVGFLFQLGSIGALHLCALPCCQFSLRVYFGVHATTELGLIVRHALQRWRRVD